jgi:MFS family permease
VLTHHEGRIVTRVQTFPTAVDRDAVQRRTLFVLWGAAILTRGAASSLFPVSVLAIKDLLGSETWAGLATGFSTVGSALSAAVLANYMQRRGRAPGLSGGFAVAAVGAVLAIVAIQMSTLVLFLPAMILVGVGSGTANLSRYAAADLATEERRSREISTVIFAATFGAVIFPLFIGVAGDVAESFSLDENAGGFSMAIILFVLASLGIWLFMRPDPLVVAGGVDRQATRKDAVPFKRALVIAWTHPLARLAFVALVVGQAVMVGVMAMTPLHMDAHGHSNGIIGAVISAHTAGMFAFAPFAGWLSDRWGRLPTIAIGGLTLVGATMFTALAGEAPRLLMFPGLFLLGLGWSFTVVAGSALLTESVETGDRVAVQGAADLATNIASGAGALLSGVVLSMSGFHTLSFIGMSAAGVLLVHSFFEHRLGTSRKAAI